MPSNRDREPELMDTKILLRQIPSVNQLVDSAVLAAWCAKLPRAIVVQAAQSVLDEHRASISKGSGDLPTTTVEDLANRVISTLEKFQSPPLSPVINATGIVIHTGLGRAPLAESAAQAVAEVARNYAPVELDLTTGDRGKRSSIVRQLLCDLTGAESATVVNNNAAALMLVLSTVANQREVIVSRGQLIEIGGSFRLPDVMAAGGTVLREVGTTNRTRLSDYQGAIDEQTAALMTVHTSNYRVEGFTESVPLKALADLAHRHGLPVIDDIGSGVLSDLGPYNLSGEPDARSSIKDGADLVLFSGDKLLGGPQAGIIVGKRFWIEKIEENPIMRAVRLDKLILTALGATLQLHRDPDLAQNQIPVLAALTTPMSSLEQRAKHLVKELQALAGITEAEAVPATAYMGGGSLPTQGVPSLAIRLRASGKTEQELATRLRTGSPPIVPRIKDGEVWLDLRTISPQQDGELIDAIRSATE